MKTYEVTVKLPWPEMLALQYALESRLEEVQIAAANEERRADQYKERGLSYEENYHRDQMARYEERAALIRTAMVGITQHTAF